MATEGIVDSSVIVSLVVPEEFSDWSEDTVSRLKSIVTLELAYYEVANALRNKVMQKELSKTDASEALDEASELILNSSVYNAPDVLSASLDIATELDVSVYDAAFLRLARKLRSKLITLDTKFAERLKGTQYYNLTVHPPIKK